MFPDPGEEVEYLVSGTGIAYVDDDAVELGPGEALFVPRNAYHGFENASDGEVVMAWNEATKMNISLVLWRSRNWRMAPA